MKGEWLPLPQFSESSMVDESRLEEAEARLTKAEAAIAELEKQVRAIKRATKKRPTLNHQPWSD